MKIQIENGGRVTANDKRDLSMSISEEHQIVQDWCASSSAGQWAATNCRSRRGRRSLSSAAYSGQQLRLWKRGGRAKRLEASGGIVVVRLASLAARGRCGRTKS